MWDRDPTLFFACGYPVVPALLVKKAFLSNSLSKSIDHMCKGLFLDSQYCSIDLCVFMAVPHCRDCCIFVVSLQIWKCDFSNLFFRWFWLFCVPYISIQMLGITFNFCNKKEGKLGFWLGLHFTVGQFWEYCQYYAFWSMNAGCLSTY